MSNLIKRVDLNDLYIYSTVRPNHPGETLEPQVYPNLQMAQDRMISDFLDYLEAIKQYDIFMDYVYEVYGNTNESDNEYDLDYIKTLLREVTEIKSKDGKCKISQNECAIKDYCSSKITMFEGTYIKNMLGLRVTDSCY